jgi:hypothetical protein
MDIRGRGLEVNGLERPQQPIHAIRSKNRAPHGQPWTKRGRHMIRGYLFNLYLLPYGEQPGVNPTILDTGTS